MALSDLKLRALKPRDKPYKISDGGGLHVLVTPAGGRLWRLSYRHAGKQKGLALGKYPEVGLAEARGARDQAKAALAAGEDPAVARKVVAKEADFQSVAAEWFERQEVKWVGTYSGRVKSRLEADIYPVIGALPIASISPLDVLAAIRSIEERGAVEMARRLLQHCGAIFRFAIATGRARVDPTYGLVEALSAAPEPRRRKALPASELPAFLTALAGYQGEVTTIAALRLVVLTAVRTQELRFARWDEFELGGKEPLWRVPVERMKMRRPHLVPLSVQAIGVLKGLHQHTGISSYLFPASGKLGVISENAMIYAMYRMGYHSRATVHGFRALFSTVLNEQGFSADAIEMQLAHAPRGVRAVYNAAEYLPERRRMMAWWGDYVDNQVRG